MSDESRFVGSDSVPWVETTSAGVRFKILHHDSVSERSSLLLRFDPGAVYALHRHPEGEEYFVLQGSVEDSGRNRPAGTFVRHPGSSAHRLVSSEGCVLFVMLPRPIEMLKPEE